MTPASDEFYRRLPKAELHCHLMGAVPAATFIELAKRNGQAPPSEDPEKVYDFVTFDEFLEVYVAVCNSVRTADEFSRVLYESLVLDADGANLRYREVMFNPTNHPWLSYSEMLEGLLDGARAAEQDRGVVCRLLPSINREHGTRAAMELVETVLAHPCDEVVGIGMDHNEDNALPELFEDVFRAARDRGLSVTTHAGEFGHAERVRTAIEVLGCRRIDHGYGVARDEELMQRAKDLGVHFTGTWSVSVDYHGDDPATQPMGRMIRGGLDVSINSDDPAMYKVDMATEWTAAARTLSLEPDDIVRACLAAVDAAWLDEDGRRALRKSFEAEIDELRALTHP
ncbi:MAG: hypothetical protein QOK00_2855 [Thermoleophilaceae bacterium]|jgi:adenosine deaminase|nr:hypothetical protein [Thermoleophilaceae bacterium]